ncbi:uncharacterized protein [Panulirus ornatus]|uniref:uncharacterized protein isoform X2 n=1 Tax=Panulirus ornatus TaxID=150431 RepID=UPI003A8C7C76
MAPPPPPPPRKISHSCSAGTLPTFTQLHVGGDGLLVVPPPARTPSAHQGHAHIQHGASLIRVWVEVRNAGLHVYPHEAASRPSLVVAQLDLCDVTVSREHTHPAHRVLVSMRGKEQVSLYLEEEAEAESWASMLRVTTVKRSLQLEGLNLECGAAGEDDDTASGDSCETESQDEEAGGPCEEVGRDADGGGGPPGSVRLRHPRRPSHVRTRNDSERRELLQQMLTTKSVLEKKQKNRRSGPRAWAVTAGEVVNEYDRAQHQAQQSALRKAVLLRQRKNSTAIKMATLERQQSSKKNRKVEVALQLEALRRRLSSLDSQLKESKQDTERTLQDLENRRNQELHLIKDLGGVDESLGGELEGVSKGCGSQQVTLVKGSHGGSLMGSLPSIPSIIVSNSERKTPEKIFGIKVGSREGRLKGRNPLHFLDLKLRVSRRHKSTECLSTPHPPHTPHRSHSSTPANGSCSDNSSDEEVDHLQQEHQQQQEQQKHQQQQQQEGPSSVRTEISKEALQEIEAFKRLIARYFATHPRHDSITSHSPEILL